jgi:hypothetical protein
MIAGSFPESLSFDSLTEWETFCQEVGGLIPVYFWKGTYRVISEKGRSEGDHGAAKIYNEIHTVAHYKDPNGTLSHHWHACHGDHTENTMYWTFAAEGESPQKIDRVSDHGAMICACDERRTIVHYATPNGTLSHHWEVSYGEQTESKAYWTFEVVKDLPQDLDRGSGYRLRFYRQAVRPGIYEVVMENGAVPHPVLRNI